MAATMTVIASRVDTDACAETRRVNLHKLSDEALMERFREGHCPAFEVLYQRHRRPLFRFIYRSVGSEALAEELFQDVWTRLIDARARYRVTARFQTYLYRVASNRVIDHVRSLKAEEPWNDEFAGHSSTTSRDEPSAHIDRDAALEALKQAIAELPLEQRTAFVLKTEQNLSLEQIAAISGVGRETIKSRLRYAMNKLRDTLGGSHESVV